MNSQFGFLARKKRENKLKREIYWASIFIIALSFLFSYVFSSKVEKYLDSTKDTIHSNSLSVEMFQKKILEKTQKLEGKIQEFEKTCHRLSGALKRANQIFTATSFELLKRLSQALPGNGIYLLSLKMDKNNIYIKGIGDSRKLITNFQDALNKNLNNISWRAEVKEENMAQDNMIYFSMEISNESK